MSGPDDKEVAYTLWTTCDIGSTAMAEGFLDVLRAVSHNWLPKLFGSHEPIRHRMTGNDAEVFSSLWMAARDPKHPFVYVLFQAARVTGARGTVHWARGPSHDFNSVTLTVPLSSYRRHADEFWAVATRLFEWAGASYGMIRTDGEFRAQHANPLPGDSLLGVRPGRYLPGVYYANLLGPEVCSFFGEERLHTCPAVRSEALRRDSWLITTAEHPGDWDTDDAVRLKQAVRAHLGERAFFDITSPERRTVHPFFDFSALRIASDEDVWSSTEVSTQIFKSSSAARQFLGDVLVLSGRLVGRLRTAELDFSVASLHRLEQALSEEASVFTHDSALTLEVAAYFGEVVRRNAGGVWAFEEKSGMAVLRLPNGTVEYPIIRALKLGENGDKLSDWFAFIVGGGERLLD